MNWLATIGNIARTISLADIVDMVVIAFVTYKILTFSARTGMINVLRGILLLVGALWLSSLLKLTALNYFLGKAMELGLLALVVLFQPELRRILERVGSGKITHFFGRTGRDANQIEQVITQVVSACSDMSRDRTGALIIFERNTAVSDPIKTGTIINADVTAELLKNIFFIKAPMHDGALIIKDNRIAAAGCMLPLSPNPNISRDLGMRHRAGLGMSEISDAVVVIVSEETGSISVAMEGMLKRHLSPKTFETLLRNELIPDEDPKKLKLDSTKVKNEVQGLVKKFWKVKQDDEGEDQSNAE